MKKYLIIPIIGFTLGFAITVVFEPFTAQGARTPVISDLRPKMGAVEPECRRIEALPDPKCNFPLENKDISLKELCHPRFRTKMIRPPTSYTTPLKLKQMKRYGFTVPDPKGKCMKNSNNPKCYQLDHLWPLFAKGHSTDKKNLWPQSLHLNIDGRDAGTITKNRLAVKLHNLLCSGKITTEQIKQGLTDWVGLYEEYIGELPVYKGT